MTRTTRMILRSLLIASLILALGVPAFAAGVSAWINSSDAKVYAESGEKGTLRAGTEVTVTAVKQGWAMFQYNGETGYVRTQYLTAKTGVTAYVKRNSFVYKSASTSSAKTGPLLVGTEVKVVGASGKFYQVTNGKTVAYIAKSALSKNKPSDKAIMIAKVQLVNWNKGNKLFSKGDYVQIYDIKSGLTIRVRRLGGTNHAELEPATAEDTDKMLKMGGGQFSWDSRPVILCVGGKYLAAAINTMPHGDESIKDNNFDGQFCLHLVGSKTHGSNVENTNHQAAIASAFKWAQTQSAKG